MFCYSTGTRISSAGRVHLDHKQFWFGLCHYVVNITHSEELEITLRYVLIDFDLAVCNHVCICLPYCISEVFLLLPYLTLRSREDVLPPGVEASNGPNVHPRISHKVK